MCHGPATPSTLHGQQAGTTADLQELVSSCAARYSWPVFKSVECGGMDGAGLAGLSATMRELLEVNKQQLACLMELTKMGYTGAPRVLDA